MITRGNNFTHFYVMVLHVGQLIRKKLKEKDITLRRFSDYMGMTERTMQHFLNREDAPLSQILRASEFLGESLLLQWMPETLGNLAEEPLLKMNILPKPRMTMTISVSGFFNEMMDSFPEFMNSVKDNADQYGFKLE